MRDKCSMCGDEINGDTYIRLSPYSKSCEKCENTGDKRKPNAHDEQEKHLNRVVEVLDQAQVVRRENAELRGEIEELKEKGAEVYTPQEAREFEHDNIQKMLDTSNANAVLLEIKLSESREELVNTNKWNHSLIDQRRVLKTELRSVKITADKSRERNGILALELEQLTEQLSIRKKYNFLKTENALRTLQKSVSDIEGALVDIRENHLVSMSNT